MWLQTTVMTLNSGQGCSSRYGLWVRRCDGHHVHSALSAQQQFCGVPEEPPPLWWFQVAQNCINEWVLSYNYMTGFKNSECSSRKSSGGGFYSTTTFRSWVCHTSDELTTVVPLIQCFFRQYPHSKLNFIIELPHTFHTSSHIIHTDVFNKLYKYLNEKRILQTK